jgi:hypothetical protein
MPRNSTGKWVARAAATGGGRTYRGQRPVNWYAGLIVIIILGLASVLFARYEYQHPKKTVSVAPTVGTHWYAGLALDECGTQLPTLAASSTTKALGITTPGNGVIDIAPLTSAQAGVHATLGQFTTRYPQLTLTSKAFEYPGKKLLNAGEQCPKGTPDAGKVGIVEVAYWANTDPETKRETVANPITLKLGSNSLVSAGFVPKGTTLPRPPQSTITGVLVASSSAPTTTTTAAPTTTSSTPSTTTPSTTTSSTPSTTAPNTTTSTTK